MKRIVLLLLVFSLIITFNSNAQYRSTERVTGCGFKIPPKSLFKSNFASVYEAKSILQNMLDTLTWKENFSMKESNGIQNAYATIINGARWIVYDNNFLEDIDEYSKTKWASVSVLAHELGHHYYNHVVSSKGSTPPTELEADALSGYLMAKLGATIDQSTAAMRAIASDNASSTHPGKADRVNAIARGWNAAKANTTATNAGNTNTGNGNSNSGNTGTGNNGDTNTGGNIPGTGTQTDPAADPSWIYLSMQSTSDQKVLLSDDGRNFQEAPIKAGEPFVFKFEVYNYGWLRLPYFNGYRTYKLMHGKDYNILWNRRTKNWTVVEVPE